MDFSPFDAVSCSGMAEAFVHEPEYETCMSKSCVASDWLDLQPADVRSLEDRPHTA